jgi:hypothetical protein
VYLDTFSIYIHPNLEEVEVRADDEASIKDWWLTAKLAMPKCMRKGERAASIWKGLGLENIILEAMEIDRSGAQVMEVLFKNPVRALPGCL